MQDKAFAASKRGAELSVHATGSSVDPQRHSNQTKVGDKRKENTTRVVRMIKKKKKNLKSIGKRKNWKWFKMAFV